MIVDTVAGSAPVILRRAPFEAAASGKTVTGENVGVSRASPHSCRRQRSNWLTSLPAARATTSGAIAAAPIRRFSSDDQRRRRGTTPVGCRAFNRRARCLTLLHYLLTKRAHPFGTDALRGERMGEVIPLFDSCSSRATADTAAKALAADRIAPEFDALASLLAVTRYWEIAITQIGICQIGLPDQSKRRLNVELASLETKLRALKAALDEHKGLRPARKP